MRLYRIAESPIGDLTIFSDGEWITGIAFELERYPIDRDGAVASDAPVLIDCERQLAEYFGGWRESFDLPLRAEGTNFQQKVWVALREIPYGETCSYGQLARRLGQPKAVRAVGHANGHNPIAIVVPCHRVIGSDGSLTGFGGGLPRKKFLLELESRQRSLLS
jgi:methylated-DNA-[protein]-cysteine S-methyltransferase